MVWVRWFGVRYRLFPILFVFGIMVVFEVGILGSLWSKSEVVEQL